MGTVITVSLLLLDKCINVPLSIEAYARQGEVSIKWNALHIKTCVIFVYLLLMQHLSTYIHV